MTAVPLPGVAGLAGQEVGRSLVLHALREPQQHPGIIVLCMLSGTADSILHKIRLDFLYRTP